MTDPVEIARGLPPAQKRALLWLPEDGSQRAAWTTIQGHPRADVMKNLNGQNLAREVRWTGSRIYRLTPLGLAVRTALVARLAAEEGDARDGE